MSDAWVIMTAMPPTKGHLNLIQFANSLAPGRLHVIVCTQPHEPYPVQRYMAVRDEVKKLGGETHWISHDIEQDPNADGFWEFWDAQITKFGFRPGDMWVTSESYGKTLAERNGGIFIPYDPGRELNNIRATRIRENPWKNFDDIMPGFQYWVRKTATFFGAESTGKTTLSKEVAKSELINGHWLYEYARPYLETVGPEINREVMVRIWKGQKAAQNHTKWWYDKPWLVQDTDLFTTIGYWDQPHWQKTLGPVPEGLIMDAQSRKSDLYIITRSNIPFEQDSIRYGVDHRESPDEYWIDLADKYDLNYIILDNPDRFHRYSASVWEMQQLFKREHGLTFERESNG